MQVIAKYYLIWNMPYSRGRSSGNHRQRIQQFFAIWKRNRKAYPAASWSLRIVFLTSSKANLQKMPPVFSSAAFNTIIFFFQKPQFCLSKNTPVASRSSQSQSMRQFYVCSVQTHSKSHQNSSIFAATYNKFIPVKTLLLLINSFRKMSVPDASQSSTLYRLASLK